MDLQSVYKDYGYPSLARFIKIVKQLKLAFTREEIQNFLAKQKVAQLHKKVVIDRKHFHPIVAANPDEEWQMDLLDFSKFYHKNKGFKWILIVVDIFTRFAYAEPIKTKGTKDVEQALVKIIDKGGVPKVIASDDGSEWKAEVKQYLDKLGVIRKINDVGDHNRLGIIDAFSKTIKHMLYKHMTASNTTDWLGVLPNFIDKYNHTPHSALCPDMTPIKAAEDPIDATNCHITRVKKAITGEKTLQVGDFVRVKLAKPVFKKGYEIKWSSKVHKVESIDTLWYTLDNGKRYRIGSLQKVEQPEDQEPVKQVVKKAKRKYKRELLHKREDIKKERIQRKPRFKNVIPANILEEGADIEFVDEQPKPKPQKKQVDKAAKLARELRKLQ